MVHPRDNRLYVASKEAVGGGLYQAPARLRSDRVNLLRRIAEVPLSITDGVFLPDGRAFVLRDYSAAHLFAAPGRQSGIAAAAAAAGESITSRLTPTGCWSVARGHSEIWRVRLPDEAATPATATSRPHARVGEWPRAPAGTSPLRWAPRRCCWCSPVAPRCWSPGCTDGGRPCEYESIETKTQNNRIGLTRRDRHERIPPPLSEPDS
jgi:hypothetical protein